MFPQLFNGHPTLLWQLSVFLAERPVLSVTGVQHIGGVSDRRWRNHTRGFLGQSLTLAERRPTRGLGVTCTA